jgi:hypothetical protein
MPLVHPIHHSFKKARLPPETFRTLIAVDVRLSRSATPIFDQPDCFERTIEDLFADEVEVCMP